MKFIPKNTLAYYADMSQRKLFDLSKYPLQSIAEATRVYKQTCALASPDLRALEFYVTNHFYSLLCSRFTLNEKLPEWAVTLSDSYRSILIEQSQRLMHYILCIITREIRHLSSAKLLTLSPKLLILSGQELVDFMPLVLQKSEMEAINMLLATPPKMGAGKYVRGLELLFNNGWPKKTSYGGKAWGNIAKCLADFIDGKTSLEMLTDTAYTLAHNGGPMFNKGMMYQTQTSGFLKILDVQRAGQIPELILCRQEYSFLPAEMSGLVSLANLAVKHMPEAFNSYVDWYKVEAAGSISTYSEYKQKQDLHNPKPKEPKEPSKFMGKTALEVGNFEVTPGEQVTVFERTVV